MCKIKKKKYVRVKGFLCLRDMPRNRRATIMKSMREHHARVCEKYLESVDGNEYDEEQSTEEN